MIPIDLSNKVALVTGGARGVGSAISRTLAKAGAHVWINYAHSEKKCEQLCEEIHSFGGRATSVKADVSQPEQVINMFKKLLDAEGRIDILVNNAGITSVKPLVELTPEEWEKILSINLDGPFLCCKEVIPPMVKAGKGTIVNISSTASITGGGGGAHYAASKSGLDSMTRALAREYAPYGIRVNGIAPTMIASDFLKERYSDEDVRSQLAQAIPLRRLGTPEDVALMTAVLCSPFTAYMSGETVLLDGGRTYG